MGTDKREVEFLQDQLGLLKQQQMLYEEMESILLKMKSLAELRKNYSLYKYEVMDLNNEMIFLEAQLQFFQKLIDEFDSRANHLKS